MTSRPCLWFTLGIAMILQQSKNFVEAGSLNNCKVNILFKSVIIIWQLLAAIRTGSQAEELENRTIFRNCRRRIRALQDQLLRLPDKEPETCHQEPRQTDRSEMQGNSYSNKYENFL